MLKEKELNERSIEEWAQRLSEEETRPMTKEEVETFITFNMNEKEIETDADIAKLFETFCLEALLWKRIKGLHSYTISKAACAMIASTCRTPGECVMYANYLQFHCSKHHIKYVDMEVLSREIFPMGFFSTGTLEKAWDSQKVESGEGGLVNLLDYPEYGKSIQL